ncbi:N-acetylmuramoyl-L-alanine amidase [Acidobacteriota bacterium]
MNSKILLIIAFILASIEVSALQKGILRQARISDDTGVIIHKDRAIYVTAMPKPMEGYEGLAMRTTGDRSNGSILLEYNQDPAPIVGKKYLIPFQYAKPELQLEAAKALFPQDSYEKERYIHVVSRETEVTQGETLWNIAFWFTGEGENFSRIMDYNALEKTRLSKDQRIVIPPALLSPAFKPQAPPEIANPKELSFEEYRGQTAAVYRLKKGETLYSSVVIRFCGRLDAHEVNQLAAEIVEFNRIEDVRDIPAGHPIKIPVKLLSPEYRPKEDPERVAYELSRHARKRFKPRYRSDNLEDVWLILDAGHGGMDTGAQSGLVCEDEYSYDILCRIKNQVQTRTRAKVIPLIKDKVTGYQPRKMPILKNDRNELLLSTPPCRLTDSRMGVNMRWVLANYHYARLKKAGALRGKIVFVSIHADSRHQDVRGAMAYLAGEEFVGVRSSVNRPPYNRYKEVKEHPVAHFPKARRVESEGLSMAFASVVIDTFRKKEIEVHKEKPIRPFVIRKNRAWVPGVLRYNEVPTKILLEVCNMNNKEDVQQLVTAAYRQKVAEAFTHALQAYFSPDSVPADVASAK